MNFTGPYSDCCPWERIEWSGDGYFRSKISRKLSVTQGMPVSIEDIARDLRVEDDDNFATLTRMARAAATFIERRSGFAVLQGRYEALFSSWSCIFATWEFMRAPLRSIVEISMLDGTQSPPDWIVQPIEHFFVTEHEKSFYVRALSTFAAPQVWAPMDGIRVRFDAGFDVLAQTGVTQQSGDDTEDRPIPDDLVTLLTMFTGELYKNREAFAADTAGAVQSIGNAMLTSVRQIW
jgi:uncharacterized phiE125 gp8 family phage protein